MEFTLTHDGEFDIAIGTTRHTITWKNKVWDWSQFLKRVCETTRTHEGYKEYCKAKKTRQDEIKDVGGFVGGFLSGGRRKKNCVLHRQLVTLDIDHIAPSLFGAFFEEFQMLYGNAACLYSTHKHCSEAPRYRLIIPLDRLVGVDEYQAIGRRIAGNLGIENFDHTTFAPERLMYWPSTSKDGEFEFQYQDGEWLSADQVLNSYRDWHDTSEWPVSERYNNIILGAIKKQGDPLEKEGVIGAWCRTYDIDAAIEKFLSDEYTVTDVEDRYTYSAGSTSGGLVVYEDKYTYSHHGTDPTSMKLCNSFDLVRIHKFGHKDADTIEEGNVVPGNKMPSYTAMVEFAIKDVEVRKRLNAERIAQANEEFSGYFDDEDATAEESEIAVVEDLEWLGKLAQNKRGENLSTLDNMVLVLENDPKLKSKFRFNSFDMREMVTGSLPWRKLIPGEEFLTDADVSNLRHYLERFYQISSSVKLEDALRIVVNRHKYHPIKDYLNGLTWDGKPRIGTLLTEYLGVSASDYTSTVMRKFLAAAVTRIFRPGCKFDYALVMIGKQGLKKSSLLDRLGGPWFSDSFTTMKGKEAYEQLQGAWLIEIAELSAMKREDIEVIKHFITKRKDRYRVSYGRRVEEFLRQCVFAATTNNVTPLRDPTGGRRFWPVVVHEIPPVKDAGLNGDLRPSVVDQIWAEAVVLYRAGEQLYLTPELEAVANSMQEKHTEEDSRAGMIREYLETPLPEDWDEKEPHSRRNYIKEFDESPVPGVLARDRICIPEIWCELFGGNTRDMTTQNTKPIHDIMRAMGGWQAGKSRTSFRFYGNQIGYYRIKNGTTTEDAGTTTEG